ncbi:Orotidine 5-phosphate decarboxylase [Corynebacterium pseudotuberculosis]|nr:Orotidine 5-phosphate decarboxylase [Corynebacterium pseudotuberculosis]
MTGSQITFGERLKQAGATHGRLCVGIDPHAALLERWGLSLNVQGLAAFTEICVEAFAGNTALVKPQVAFYESYGSSGFAILEDAISHLRDAGTLVLADAKRGDIGSTMAGYATAWLDDASPLCCDAVTVSPYLGYGSLKPVLDIAEQKNRGVFVLAATSNPEARLLQDHRDSQGRTISQQIVDSVARDNAEHAAVGNAGNIGVVVGATLVEPPNLSQLAGPVLLPGVGAQGATAEDITRITEGITELAFPNISRAILSRGPSVEALKDAVALSVLDFRD